MLQFQPRAEGPGRDLNFVGVGRNHHGIDLRPDPRMRRCGYGGPRAGERQQAGHRYNEPYRVHKENLPGFVGGKKHHIFSYGST